MCDPGGQFSFIDTSWVLDKWRQPEKLWLICVYVCVRENVHLCVRGVRGAHGGVCVNTSAGEEDPELDDRDFIREDFNEHDVIYDV